MSISVFTDPQSPFELHHNQQVFQQMVQDGRYLAFRSSDGRVLYATPDRAFQAILDGATQITLDELKQWHETQLSRFVGKNAI